MRELKFRAWVARYKKYMPIISITWDTSNRPMLIKLEDTFGDSFVLNSEDVLLEQYTGLKDKNGKEIYEGDIVRIDSMDELRTGYVDLLDDQYLIVCGADEDGYKIVAEFYYYSKPEENCKVIGNIHENKELLEVEE